MSNVTTELSLTPGCQRLGLGYWQKADPRALSGWFVRHGVCVGVGVVGVVRGLITGTGRQGIDAGCQKESCSS